MEQAEVDEDAQHQRIHMKPTTLTLAMILTCAVHAPAQSWPAARIQALLNTGISPIDITLHPCDEKFGTKKYLRIISNFRKWMRLLRRHLGDAPRLKGNVEVLHNNFGKLYGCLLKHISFQCDSSPLFERASE